MQFLSRLFSRFAPGTVSNAAPRPPASLDRPASGLSDDDSELHPMSPQAERAQRREQLYEVVREGMMRIGVLSSNYKFKVLALDPRGRQFLIMMDLADNALPEERWHESEELLAQAARARFDIGIKAVYWRVNHQLQHALASAGQPARQTSSRSRLTPLELPLSERPTVPAPLAASPAPRRPPSQPDPIQPDEVAALGKALAAARQNEALPQPSPSSPRRRPTWRTSALAGFEDTRIFPDTAPGFVLSPTQYGELN